MNTLVAPPERQATMRLPGGRTLAWSEWGPAGGLPVVFCTGAALSGWLGFGAQALPGLGLRLLAVDRPGLGRSTPHPTKTLATWVDDSRHWLREQGLRTVLAVGFSQGAPFAYALAGARLVDALAIVAGQDDFTHPRVNALLHPEVRGMVEAVRRDAAGFERHFAQIATAEGLWQLITGMGAPRDRALYEHGAFGEAFRRALAEGFARGAEGYARDLANALGPWPVALEDVAVPVDLWYGGLDTSTVHAPDFGATQAARLPHASHTVDPGEGGSILWTRAGDILARLKAHVSPA